MLITRTNAYLEIVGMSDKETAELLWCEFLLDCGDKEMYTKEEVNEWLANEDY